MSSSVMESEMEMSKSEGESVEVASAGTGRRTWSSLLINPFRATSVGRALSNRTISTSSPRKLRPLHLLSGRMKRFGTSSSVMSNATDAASIEVNSYRTYMLDREKTASSSTTMSHELLDRARVIGGHQVTAKFPERLDTDDREWTSFKVILLLSVLSVSLPHLSDGTMADAGSFLGTVSPVYVGLYRSCSEVSRPSC